MHFPGEGDKEDLGHAARHCPPPHHCCLLGGGWYDHGKPRPSKPHQGKSVCMSGSSGANTPRDCGRNQLISSCPCTRNQRGACLLCISFPSLTAIFLYVVPQRRAMAHPRARWSRGDSAPFTSEPGPTRGSSTRPYATCLQARPSFAHQVSPSGGA